MAQTHCRYFNGYKPCGKYEKCDTSCPFRDVPETRICMVHLGAMGAVLRSTSLLPAIKRKYPSSHITWITDKPAGQLLKNNHYIDSVYETGFDTLLELSGRKFEVVYVVDKSAKATGFLSHLKYDKSYGFKKDPISGGIIPANSSAEELWSLGLNNQKKFYENLKPETQLMVEAFELGNFVRDPYQVFLTAEEKSKVALRRGEWGSRLIGINTACSPMIPYRKFTIDFTRKLIADIAKENLGRVVLLGGPGEAERNRAIAEGYDVVQSPTQNGVRDGLLSAAACDVIVSGDSLGMHMGIALKKWVVAWFGPTCQQEIDIYDRGVKVLSQVGCSPCWKRHCEKERMCYDLVDVNEILSGIREGLRCKNKSLSYKQPLSEISF